MRVFILLTILGAGILSIATFASSESQNRWIADVLGMVFLYVFILISESDWGKQ